MSRGLFAKARALLSGVDMPLAEVKKLKALKCACMEMQRLRDADDSRAEAEQRRKVACFILRRA